MIFVLYRFCIGKAAFQTKYIAVTAINCVAVIGIKNTFFIIYGVMLAK